MNRIRLELRTHTAWWLNLVLPLAAIGLTLVLCERALIPCWPEPMSLRPTRSFF